MRPQDVIPAVVKRVGGETYPEGAYMINNYRAAELVNGKWIIYGWWTRRYWQLWRRRQKHQGEQDART